MMPFLGQFMLLTAVPFGLLIVIAGVYLFSRDSGRRSRAIRLLTLFLRHQSQVTLHHQSDIREE